MEYTLQMMTNERRSWPETLLRRLPPAPSLSCTPWSWKAMGPSGKPTPTQDSLKLGCMLHVCCVHRNLLADDVYMRRPISYLVLAFCNRVSVKS